MPTRSARDVSINLVTPRDPVIGTVVENTRLTDASSPNIVRHVAVEVEGTPLEGSFLPGQAFGVIPEWESTLDENEIHIRSDDRQLRLYSLACPSGGEKGEGRIISTTVKRVIDEHWEDGRLFLGACSNYLCDLRVGDDVRVTGPVGRHFLLPPEDRLGDHRYVFLAAGTGIAPFRGMVRELLDAGVEREIWLIEGVPYFTDLLYESEFGEWEKVHDNVHFLEAVSRQQSTSDGSKMYVQDRLLEHGDRFTSLLEDSTTLIYICGLKGMETGIYRALLELGREELFQSVPDSLRGEDVAELSDRAEPLGQLRPNKDRVKVEVY